MLLLTFRAAASLYAIDVSHVVEVLPRIDLRRLPHAPASLAGLLDYRGVVVPVIDMGILLGSDACRTRLSTRIILVNCRSEPRTREQPAGIAHKESQPDVDPGWGKPGAGSSVQPLPWLLGVIAEQVSDVASIKPNQVVTAPFHLSQTPYLGAIVELDHQMAQLIEVDRVLDEQLREAFYGSHASERPDDVSPGETQARLTL
jgi:chemotaxis-related protein WspB